MTYQSHDQTWKEMVQDGKNLSDKLKEMGFDEKTFMVVKEWENIKVSEGQRDGSGQLIENPYLSFGGQHRHPSDEQHRTDFEIEDASMGRAGPGGKIAVGMVGSNNGMYAAKVFHGNEMIITQDPQIIDTLRKELNFAEGLGVPMSNGGVMVDYKRQQEFENMKWACARKADREGQEKRTAAVQRGDIITTYDPNDKSADGVYNNVRHYEKTPDGNLRSISVYEASNKLQLNAQYNANSTNSIQNGGEKLDIAKTNSMLASKLINYGGR